MSATGEAQAARRGAIARGRHATAKLAIAIKEGAT